MGSGAPSTSRRGSVCFGGSGALSPAGVDGATSLTTVLGRLRFNEDFAALAGVSLGVSGTGGAASSRARALVDRRGSDIGCVDMGVIHHAIAKNVNSRYADLTSATASFREHVTLVLDLVRLDFVTPSFVRAGQTHKNPSSSSLITRPVVTRQYARITAI